MSRNVRRPVRAPTPSYRPSSNLPAPTKDRGWRKAKRFAVLAIAGLLVAVAWFGGQVRRIDVVNSDRPDRAAELISASLKQFPLWSRHLLFIDNQTLADQVVAAYPDEIAKLKISKNWLSQALTADVEDSKAVISWQSGGETYGVNQRGIITGQVQGSRLPLVIDSTNLEARTAQAAAPEQFISFVLTVHGQLKTITGLSWRQARVVDSTNELFVDTTRGYYLRFDTSRAAGEQLAAAAAVLKKGAKPASYIDLRLAHKVYYR